MASAMPTTQRRRRYLAAAGRSEGAAATTKLPSIKARTLQPYAATLPTSPVIQSQRLDHSPVAE
jgi:hypothetical protein